MARFMKRILFIGHDASRTGAPFILLHLLRWLKQNAPDYRFELLLLTGGELEDEFRKICDVHILRRHIGGSGVEAVVSKSFRALRKKLGGEHRLLSRLAAKHSLVLGNTAVTLEQLNFFKQRGCTTICWMHEMDYALDLFFPREKFSNMAGMMDGFIVGSKAVREMLVRRGIEKPVNIVYEFLNIADVPTHAQADIRTELGIPADAFVVGACATIEWRKGVDLYVQIAKRLTEKSTNVFCLWVGGRYPNTKTTYEQLQFDIRRLGLEDRILFVDVRHDLSDYYRAMDVFVLPSREDPFPLVCLEAARFEMPVLCFENAGGMPEFVEDDAGFVVPYLDLDVMADEIGELHADPQLRERMGKAAAAKVRDRHDISKAGPEMLKIIEDHGTK